MRWIFCVSAAVALWTMAVLPASVVQGKPAYNCSNVVCQCDNETGCMEMEKKGGCTGPTSCQKLGGKTICQCDKTLVKNQSTQPQRVPAASRSQ